MVQPSQAQLPVTQHTKLVVPFLQADKFDYLQKFTNKIVDKNEVLLLGKLQCFCVYLHAAFNFALLRRYQVGIKMIITK